MVAGVARRLNKRKAAVGTKSAAVVDAGAPDGEVETTAGDADRERQADAEQHVPKRRKKKAATNSGTVPPTVEEEVAERNDLVGRGVMAATSDKSDDMDKQLTTPRRKKAASLAETGQRGASSSADGSKFTETGKTASASRTVFVDGVPYVWSREKLEEQFQNCGTILEVRAPMWQDSGRLRGYAHVTFASEAAWKKALTMDGASVGKKGRYLKIEPAKEEVQATSRLAAKLEGQCRLFVKNLPYDVTENELATLFRKHGKVREVRVPTSFGRSKGFAYVEFVRPDALCAVVEAKPPPALRGRILHLDVDAGSGPKAGFHYRPEAYESGFGPKLQGSGVGGNRGGRKGKQKGGWGR